MKIVNDVVVTKTDVCVNDKGTFSVKLTLDVDGVKMYVDYWLSNAALENTTRQLTRAFNWGGGDISIFATEDFIGTKIQITTEEEEYNGKISTKIKFINSNNYVHKSSLEPAELTKLSESLKGKILAYRQKNPTQDKEVF